jgi:hypothetical protein
MCCYCCDGSLAVSQSYVISNCGFCLRVFEFCIHSANSNLASPPCDLYVHSTLSSGHLYQSMIFLQGYLSQFTRDSLVTYLRWKWHHNSLTISVLLLLHVLCCGERCESVLLTFLSARRGRSLRRLSCHNINLRFLTRRSL